MAQKMRYLLQRSTIRFLKKGCSAPIEAEALEIMLFYVMIIFVSGMRCNCQYI